MHALKYYAVLTAALLILCVPASADEIHRAMYPSLSPDGETLAFGFLGDLWTVSSEGGRAERLTVHTENDICPVWSPDGRYIAFSSARQGNYDIYVMSSRGGHPRRLTFHSGPDVICDWSPDGDYILFQSYREFRYTDLYKISVEGGMPVKLTEDGGRNGRFSPDGKSILYNRGNVPWWRRGYRGSGNLDIWIMEEGENLPLRTAGTEANESGPMWAPDGEGIYYINDAAGVYNLTYKNLDSGGERSLTNYDGESVFRPRISAGGGKIVYRYDFGIWIYDLNSGEPREVKIDVSADYKFNNIDKKVFTADASEFRISPDEKEYAFVVHGELFALYGDGDENDAVRLTETSWREKDSSWAPDGLSIAYVTDRNGNLDIYMVKSTDDGEERLSRSRHREERPLADSGDDEYRPVWSPSGDKVVFLKNKGILCALDPDSGKSEVIDGGPFTDDPRWSPDGKWLAYSKPDRYFRDDIYIIPSEGGEPVNITRHPASDVLPRWSDDGKTIYFISHRKDNWDIWEIALEKERLEEEDGEVEENEKAGEDGGKDDAEEKKPVEVVIDFKDIHRRAEQITRLQSSEWDAVLSPDGEHYAFTSDTLGNWDLWIAAADGGEMKQLTHGGKEPRSIGWSKDSATIYYLDKNGRYHSIGKDGNGGKTVSFSARMNIDKKAEMFQMFDEAWHYLRRQFYDRDYHGVDWETVRNKYRPFIEEIATKGEFRDLVREMIGELNSSHLGIWGPGEEELTRTAYPGLIFDEDYGGPGLKIAEILKDGPADKKDVDIEPGEYLIAVDGEEVNPGCNYYIHLNDKVDRMVDLTVSSNRSGKNARMVEIKPIDWKEGRDLLYERWVDRNRRKVDELSGGRLGYIHIKAMNNSSLEAFERELFAEVNDKEGLVLDVRFNPGGYIHDSLLNILDRRIYGYYKPRDGWLVPQPARKWDRPTVLLINENSFSDSEVFPNGFKQLGLGKVVGVPTWGGVIGTGGTKLIDGSHFRLPRVGWYTLSGENLENMGVEPDIYVRNVPGDDRDYQLRKAVETVIEEIKEGGSE